MSHANTAIVLVAVAVVFFYFNSLEPNKGQNNKQPN